MNRRLVVLLLLIFWISASYGQAVKNDSLILQSKISIIRNQSSLIDILTEIQENYNINFSYTDDLISLEQLASIEAKNQPLNLVLDHILSGKLIRYVLIGKQIVLVKSKLPDNEKNQIPSASSKDSLSSIIKKAEIGSFKLDRKNIKNIKEWEKRNKINNRSESFNSKYYPKKHVPDSSDVSRDSLDKLEHSSKNEYHKNLKRNGLKYFSLDINFTAGHSFKKLIFNTDEGSDINNQRNQERGKFGYNSEIICSFYLSHFFSLHTGFGILNSVEEGKIDYFEHGYIPIPGGNRISNITYTNRYCFFTIPFLSGYTYHTGSFSLKLITGIIPSVLISTGNNNMKYYNYDYYFNYINTNTWQQQGMQVPQTVKYRKFNLAYSFRMEGNYQIGKLAIALGLNYNHFLYSTYLSSAPIKEKIILPGISLSLKYYF